MTENMTANGKYNYNQEFYKMTLNEWVQNAHKFNCLSNNWNHHPLKKGAFGYDNLAVSISHTLTSNDFLLLPKILNDEHINILSKLIHEGWSINYIYWRDNEPYINNNLYLKPYNKLDDERRNICAQIEFNDLEQDEKDKDIILAKFLINEINRINEDNYGM